MSNTKILRLRIELYTAAQSLTGEDANEFWELMDEIMEFRNYLMKARKR